MFSHPKILFLVSLLFVALLNSTSNIFPVIFSAYMVRENHHIFYHSVKVFMYVLYSKFLLWMQVFAKLNLLMITSSCFNPIKNNTDFNVAN